MLFFNPDKKNPWTCKITDHVRGAIDTGTCQEALHTISIPHKKHLRNARGIFIRGN